MLPGNLPLISADAMLWQGLPTLPPERTEGLLSSTPTLTNQSRSGPHRWGPSQQRANARRKKTASAPLGLQVPCGRDCRAGSHASGSRRAQFRFARGEGWVARICGSDPRLPTQGKHCHSRDAISLHGSHAFRRPTVKDDGGGQEASPNNRDDDGGVRRPRRTTGTTTAGSGGLAEQPEDGGVRPSPNEAGLRQPLVFIHGHPLELVERNSVESLTGYDSSGHRFPPFQDTTGSCEKNSLPLSSTRMKAGKSTTSIL